LLAPWLCEQLRRKKDRFVFVFELGYEGRRGLGIWKAEGKSYVR